MQLPPFSTIKYVRPRSEPVLDDCYLVAAITTGIFPNEIRNIVVFLLLPPVTKFYKKRIETVNSI